MGDVEQRNSKVGYRLSFSYLKANRFFDAIDVGKDFLKVGESDSSEAEIDVGYCDQKRRAQMSVSEETDSNWEEQV